jgi:hypothetical protein
VQWLKKKDKQQSKKQYNMLIDMTGIRNIREQDEPEIGIM